MIDLKDRFDELRDVERRRVPAFEVGTRRHFAYRWAFALLLIVVIVSIGRQQRTNFSDEDREAARAISTWHAPTDVLLKGATR